MRSKLPFAFALSCAVIASAADRLPVFRPGTRILFQGDSITALGRGLTPDPNHVLGHSYVFLIAAKYGSMLPDRNLVFLNRAIGGNKLADMALRWQKDALELKPDILSILIGINDVGHDVPFEQFEPAYDKLLADSVAQNPELRIVLGEPFTLPTGKRKENWEKWRAEVQKRQDVVAKLAAKYHAAVVHYQRVFDQACKRAPAEYWIWDGVHPTYSGHQLMADEWVRTVQEFWPASTQNATSSVIDVYLLGGQSNATGQGYMRNLPPGWTPDGRVLLFTSDGRRVNPEHPGGGLNSGGPPYTWIPLRQASESPDRFGPELGFGNRMRELTPTRRIAIIKHAWSGTNLYKDWAPGKDPADSENWGRQFRALVDTVNQGMEELRRRGDRPVIRGMLWQQGESDAAGAGPQYAGNLARFIARLREQFQAPDMAFVYGYVCPPPGKRPGCEVIRQAERDIDQNSGSPLAVKNAFVVETDGLSHRAEDAGTPLPGDHVHFGTAGTLELGTRFADRMYGALRERLR